jgi:hypothetical protein
MSKGRQTTLFGAIGGGGGNGPRRQDPRSPVARKDDVITIDEESTPGPESDDFQFDEDFFADDLTGEELQKLEDQAYQGPSEPIKTANQKSKVLKQSTIPFHIGPSAASHSILNCSIIEDEIPGFDLEAGEMWIYPTNYPVRDYQFNITKKALFINTLVCLPTGLGKTFIAAVVMYNFYRWYPVGKIVFLAPTKPLVAQQIEACYNVMGIPQEDIAEMTGE